MKSKDSICMSPPTVPCTGQALGSHSCCQYSGQSPKHCLHWESEVDPVGDLPVALRDFLSSGDNILEDLP